MIKVWQIIAEYNLCMIYIYFRIIFIILYWYVHFFLSLFLYKRESQSVVEMQSFLTW